MTSNVYFFQHTTLPLVKIGKADDWAIRALQVGGVELIDFERSMFKEVADSTTAYDLERMMHVLFEDRRVPDPTGLSGGTEWFCETVMGEVRKVVRGLSTCDGSQLLKKTKRVRVINLPNTNILEMMLPELLSVIENNCLCGWWGNSFMFKPKSESLRPFMNNILDRLITHTDPASVVRPRFKNKPWELSGDFSKALIQSLQIFGSYPHKGDYPSRKNCNHDQWHPGVKDDPIWVSRPSAQP